MDFSGLRLVSFNKDKLKEFRSYGLTGLRTSEGKDLREVYYDPLTVSLYKSLDAGDGHIVEDTSLFIEGEEIGGDVKFQLANITKYLGRKAVFTVYLAVNLNGVIEIFEDSVNGIISIGVKVPLGEKIFVF
jgi:hypothetical protein